MENSSDQDTYGTGTIDHTFRDNWNATVRYGLVRKREESEQWYPAGIPMGGLYYGNDVTVLGANGYASSGQALMNYGTEFRRDLSVLPGAGVESRQPLRPDDLRAWAAPGRHRRRSLRRRTRA